MRDYGALAHLSTPPPTIPHARLRCDCALDCPPHIPFHMRDCSASARWSDFDCDTCINQPIATLTRASSFQQLLYLGWRVACSQSCLLSIRPCAHRLPSQIPVPSRRTRRQKGSQVMCRRKLVTMRRIQPLHACLATRRLAHAPRCFVSL